MFFHKSFRGLIGVTFFVSKYCKREEEERSIYGITRLLWWENSNGGEKKSEFLKKDFAVNKL